MMEAELHDGTILEFPDGTDQSVIQSAVKKVLAQAQNNGGFVSESPIVPQRQPQGQERIDPNKGIGALEAGTISAGRGIMTIMRGLGISKPEDPTVTESFKKLEEKHPISTISGEILGESAPFLLPGVGLTSIASIPARAAAAALLGASEGSLITAGKGGETDEIVGSGLVGGTVAVLLSWLCLALVALAVKLSGGP